MHHFATIGFEFQTGDELAALGNRAASKSEAIPVGRHTYHRWIGNSGEEMWLKVDQANNVIGVHPHFGGSSVIPVGIKSRVHRPDPTGPEGAFLCWAVPEDDLPDSGMFPFVFDVPDYARYKDIEIPGMATAQVAAFAFEVSCHPTVEDFDAAQQPEGPGPLRLKPGPRSFFVPDLFWVVEAPKAEAAITGVVDRGSILINELTGIEFYWAQVDTLAVKLDVVMHRSLLKAPPSPGNVLQGYFWLCGRLIEYTRRRHGLLGSI